MPCTFVLELGAGYNITHFCNNCVSDRYHVSSCNDISDFGIEIN
jgi:hypothetical protein